MQTRTTDVVIHTRSTLSEAQFSEVSRQVKAIDGVVRFERNPGRPNFILVAYKAGQIRALTILNKLTRLGFNASLIGI